MGSNWTICVGAEKERDIESKLSQIVSAWSINLSFSFFKSRVELLLKWAEIQEIVAKIQDSLMMMNSPATKMSEWPYHIYLRSSLTETHILNQLIIFIV